MVDKSLILRKLAELEEYLEQIKEYSNITVDEYSGDWKIHLKQQIATNGTNRTQISEH